MRSILIFTIVAILVAIAQAQDVAKPSACGKHATYYTCGANCDTYCATLNQPCTIQYIRCPDGCYCDKGYARDANGVCIPVGNC